MSRKRLGALSAAMIEKAIPTGHYRGRCGSYLGNSCGHPCQGRMTKEEYEESEREQAANVGGEVVFGVNEKIGGTD